MPIKDGPVFDQLVQAPVDPPEVGATSAVFQFRPDDHSVVATIHYGTNAQYVAVALLDPALHPGVISANDVRKAVDEGAISFRSEILSESPLVAVLEGNYEPNKEYRAVAASWLVY